MASRVGIWLLCALILCGEVWAAGPVGLAKSVSSTQSSRALVYRARAVRVLGNRRRRALIPGSAHAVNRKQLERFETDDIHRGLAEIPGVYVREEDGYGLRPNIGMRGANSERSAKVTLMEDGVLIAPGAYAAPAAYFFPLVTRLVGIEVLKGPAGVRFGPATVGGAVNLLSAPIPTERLIIADLAGGNFGYAKAHLGYGESLSHVGWWVEGVGLRSSGFKELDSGGPTGFRKWEVLGKLRLNTSTNRKFMQSLELRADFSDELSHESYTGLSDADFKANPWRRYSGTQNDLMQWNRFALKATHEVRFNESWRLRTDAYRHHFERTWGKLARFAVGKTVDEVLTNPASGSNSVLYGVLSGEMDSTDETEGLILGTNARQFTSMGVQSQLTGNFVTGRLFGRAVKHDLTVGLRLHHDEVRRSVIEETFFMLDGSLVAGESTRQNLRDVTGTTLALAGWAQDTVQIGQVRLSAGMRIEHIGNTWTDTKANTDDTEDPYTTFVPGLGILWEPIKGLGVLAGVNRGFTPVSPGQQAGVLPELSWNYEAGVRWNKSKIRFEAIGFFNDYSNIKGTCSFSAGCDIDTIGQEFNGGRVWIWGLESTAGVLLTPSRGIHVPLSLTYTLTQSEFQTAFYSSNPQWGQVQVGFSLPYVPEHQWSIATGVRWGRFDLGINGRFASPMRNAASDGDDVLETDMISIIDAALNVDLGRWGKVYVNVRNLLDSAQVVSLRPFGARPGMPRQVMVGYKYRL